MYVFGVRSKRRRVMGGGLFDWIPKIASAFGRVGNFISRNKDTITNVANVAGSVAKAGATTASAVRNIVDAVKAKRAAAAAAVQPAAAAQPAAALPIPLEKALSEKSIEFLKQLANSSQQAQQVQPATDINSLIAGSGFKTLQAVNRRGKGLFRK